MPGDDFIAGILVGRRRGKPWRPGARKSPKMPSGPWRVAALVCFVVGGSTTWLMFGGDGSVGPLRAVFGGLVAVAIGMYVVESVWERWYQRRDLPPTSPIGRRR